MAKTDPAAEPFFSPSPIQTKLNIGQPNDKYEREADQTAEKVVQQLSSPEVQTKAESPGISKLQTISAPPATDTRSPVPNAQRKCAKCEQEDLALKEESVGGEEEVRRKPIFESGSGPPDDESVQRRCAACEAQETIQPKAAGGGESTADSGLETQLNTTKGSGSPLPEGTRSSMESAFGSDFSGVRVHTDSSAVQMNRDLGARAFTHGSDIYFNSGQYDTNSSEGNKLLAHELTHTVQQGGEDHSQKANKVQTKLEVNTERQFEDEAERTVIPSNREQARERGESSDSQDETPSAEEVVTSESESSTEEADESSEESETTTDSKSSSTSESETTEAPSTDISTSETNNGGSESAESDAESARTESSEGETSAGGDCTPECYTGTREQPEEEPDEQPSDPPAGEVEAEASEGDEEELPEIDDCREPPAEAEAVANESETPESAEMGPLAGAELMVGGGNVGGASGSSGAPEGVMEGMGDSALTGVISSAESERSMAVSAYEASSMALSSNSSRTEPLRNGVQFKVSAPENPEIQEQRSLAASRTNWFFSAIANRLDQASTYALEDIPNQLGVSAESAKAQISASMEAQKMAISARIQQARSQAMANAESARAAVRAQAAAYVAEVQTQTATAIETLTTTRGQNMEQVNALESTTLDSINNIYAEGRTSMETLGASIGSECTAKGEEFASTYEGFRDCTENGFWDGDLSGRRAEAQAEAARSVAESYNERMIDAARKRAREVTRNGRQADRCSIIESANQSRNTLDGQLPNLISAFEMTRDSAIEQAGVTESSLISSIDSSLASTLSQLDQQEHSQRQAINDTGYMQQVVQEQIAFAAASAVQQGVQNGINDVQDTILDVQARFASSEAPDPVMLETAFSQVEQNVNGAMDELHSSADTGTSTAESKLSEALQQAITSLEGITQSNDEGAAELSNSFSTAMSGIADTDNFATQRATFTQQVEQSVIASVGALNQILTGFQESCDTTMEGARNNLAEAYQSLEENLRLSRQGLECDMTSKADKAASEEAPAWKRVLAVVLIIIVVIIVIAVTVITAGAAGPVLVAFLGGPLLAGAIIGAVVGAVVSGLITMATNLWSNRDVMEGVGKAVAVGFITGAAGGFLGAAAGAGAGALFSTASKGVQVAAQFGAAMISGGGFDVVTQFVSGGFSFDNFSWSQLGITLLSTAITFGIGHAAGSRSAASGIDGPDGAPVVDTPESTTTTDTPEQTTTTDTPEQTTTTDTPEQTTTTDTPEQTTTTDTPEQTTTTDTPEQTTTTDTPEQTTTTDTPEQTTTTDTPEQTTTTDTPEQTTTTDTPEQTTTTDTPEQTTTTDTPEPTTNRDTPESTTNRDTPEQIARNQKTEADLDAELTKRGLNEDSMFEGMDPQTQSKVNTALKNDPIAKADQNGATQKAVQDWAMEGAGGNPREFANRYEYARAKFNQARSAAREQLAGQPNARNRAAEAASEAVTPERLNADLGNDLQTVRSSGHGENLEGIPPNATPEDIAQGVQNLDRVTFESETAAAYHAQKHHSELPQSLRTTGDPVADYISATQNTIRTGNVIDASPAGQSTRVVIRKNYDGVVMEAIVYVNSEGSVNLATYGKPRFRP